MCSPKSARASDVGNPEMNALRAARLIALGNATRYILYHAARLTGVPVRHDFLDCTRHPLVILQQALR
eukprot:1872363-Pleurochrysis_carterae.AAC.1